MKQTFDDSKRGIEELKRPYLASESPRAMLGVTDIVARDFPFQNFGRLW